MCDLDAGCGLSVYLFFLVNFFLSFSLVSLAGERNVHRGLAFFFCTRDLVIDVQRIFMTRTSRHHLLVANSKCTFSFMA
jgi:hypothetical protein